MGDREEGGVGSDLHICMHVLACFSFSDASSHSEFTSVCWGAIQSTLLCTYIHKSIVTAQDLILLSCR